MTRLSFSARMPRLLIGAAALALAASACNKQPSMTEAPAVAPPVAALPMATGSAPPVAPAPMGSALPPAPTPVGYAPPAPDQRYGDMDRAYAMTQAFADTPPDYAVDYEGTRPWIWRARNGAYRIVERLPRGERYYYYEPGQDYPFLVQDPEYSYAYDNGRLMAVYGSDGSALADALAARRADEASRYLYRARQLYRAAQYDQRQSAYADEWASRRYDFRNQDQRWRQQQASNPDWRSWHDSHAAQEQQRWGQERDQRVAYATALGIAAGAVAGASLKSGGAPPSPAEVAQRQASYFAKWKGSHGQAPAPAATATSKPTVTPTQRTAPAPPSQAAPAQVKVAQAKAAEANVAQAKAADAQRRAAAAAQAKTMEAQHAQQLAAQAKDREAAAAKAKAAQAEHAQQLAAEAKQHEAAAAQTKAASAKAAEAKAAEAKAAEAKAAEAKAGQAQHAQQAAAQAKQREAAAAKAKADEAKAAEAKAAEAKARQVKDAQAKETEAKQKAADKASTKDAKKQGQKDRKSQNPQ